MKNIFLISGPPSQQYRPSPQYQGQQQAYQNFATTQSSAVGSSQTGGPGGGNVYNQPPNQPYPGQGYGHQQPVPGSNYPNPNYGNPPSNQQYQPNGPYGNQQPGSYPQTPVGPQPQNFPPNYPPAGYVQQPVSSSSGYGPVTNQPSSYTGYGNVPQNTYASSQTTQSAPSASTQTYPPPPNQPVSNAGTVQQPVPAPQPNYPAPQQPNAQSYQSPNNGPNQQPGPPQNYPPQQGYNQPPPQGYPQGYPAPGQPGGYQQYPQRPLAPPSNQSQYPGYSYQPSPV